MTQARDVPIGWAALEDAFENNANDVHSYLNLNTGDVVRIVDGVADAAMHRRIQRDPDYLRIDPVSSREQYRWMEHFIATVDEMDLRKRLIAAIDGKGAFRRFKDVLMNSPVDRERWFTFRSDRLRVCMEGWLSVHGITSVDRPKWKVPSADEVEPKEQPAPLEPLDSGRREELLKLIDALPLSEHAFAASFLSFLITRRPAASNLPPAPATTGASASEATSATESEAADESPTPTE